MIRATILLATALLFFNACNASQYSKVITPTPVEYHIYTYKVRNLVSDGTRQYVAPEILPDMLQEYQLTVKKETTIRAESSAPVIKIADQAVDNSLQVCYNNPDRFNWQKYASAYSDWSLSEAAYIIKIESGGDLCAINSSSYATCWWQIYPGGEQYLDPVTCTSVAHAKWLDGGGSFYKHWIRWE